MIAILGRVWPYLALAGVIIGSMLWIDSRGYQRAKDDQAKADARRTKELVAAIVVIDRKHAARIAAIDNTERTVTNTLIREVQSDARYSDPAGLSPSIVHQLNEARAASCPTGGDCRAVPATPPAN